MKTYKFRAECSQDVIKWLSFMDRCDMYPCLDSIIRIKDYPDVECVFQFSDEIEIHDLISTMKQIEDGHVMWQTLQPINDFTGERIMERLAQ